MKTTGNLNILAKHFSDENAAIEMLESLRWPNGAVCPKCGGADPYRLTPKPTTTGRSIRKGLWKCRACRKQFTVKVGTVFEQSHIPVSKWLLAIHLLCASKKGMSAHQFHRMLGMTYRSAWFMAHRLRHAMTTDGFMPKLSGLVEADETYVGGKRRAGNCKDGRTKLIGRPGPDDRQKTPVVALVERKGRVVCFPVERVTSKTLQDEIRSRVNLATHMMTDDLKGYDGLNMGFMGHDTVTHSNGEYVRGDVHTNTVEGFFSILKRGLNGVYHHVSKGHLHRYCDEFAFRYSNRSALGVSDGERAALMILGAEGKRLTFKQPSGACA
jgi:transposase-like protein